MSRSYATLLVKRYILTLLATLWDLICNVNELFDIESLDSTNTKTFEISISYDKTIMYCIKNYQCAQGNVL